jgi:hypothetical protein
MVGLIYILVMGGLKALLKKKWSDVYMVIISLSILARWNISSLYAIKVYLRCILVLIKPKDFLIVLSISKLRVTE